MLCHGINVEVQEVPVLDKAFIPLIQFNRAFLQSARRGVAVGIAVTREEGKCAVVETFIHGTKEMRDADCYYIDRLVKTMLWMKGGYRIDVTGSEMIVQYLQEAYSETGSRAFDASFMSFVYERPFEVRYVLALPEEKDAAKEIGGHTDGCRIGFDAGGSDRKVSAVIDGKSVFDEEIVWHPKTQSDPSYHYEGIVSAFKSAAAHMPRVDAVGISSAGIYIGNRTMRASLFNQVPPDLTERFVRDIYIRAVRDTFGDVPFAVVNDGDVSALAGKMSLGANNLLGIAMGTSEAAGFVDRDGCITGWLNELAFVPVDCAPDAMRDEWSTDIGCGVKYFSQDAVIKLAPRAGITLDDALSPAEKLVCVQELMEKDDARAAQIYDTIGTYLGHTLAFYHALYGMSHVLLLGRVMSGKGGGRIIAECERVLKAAYPEIAPYLSCSLPDERFRRIGQSAAAASLPAL